MTGLRALVFFAVVFSSAAVAAGPAGDSLFDLGLVPLDGQPPPAFSLPGLDGRPVSLAQLNGHVVFLYFWASW